jgi:hypothetical protein
MFTDTEKREAVEREAKMRRRVYPRWIKQKKMSQREAYKQIALMDEIADDYRKKELVLL